MQGKLLTLLQNRTYSRVGSHKTEAANIRVIAATNRNLEALIDAGEFRRDLYFRLRVIELEMPPLRDRGREDLLSLIDHFVDQAAKRHGRPIDRITPEALDALLAHPWPGNVRELENCLEAAVIFAEGETIDRVGLSLPGLQTESVNPFRDEPNLEQLEERYIAFLLKEHHGNRSECARILGIGRNTLLRKMKKFELI